MTHPTEAGERERLADLDKDRIMHPRPKEERWIRANTAERVPRFVPCPRCGGEVPTCGEAPMLRYRANEVVRLAEKYREQWSDRPDAYWLMRLMQEVGELASVLAGDHDDTVEHELRQVASIALNWLRRIPITVAPGNAWSSRPTTPVEEEDDGR